jgi:hypothetical protein
MEYFLKAKHWQIFIIIVVMPFIISVLSDGFLIINENSKINIIFRSVIPLILTAFSTFWILIVSLGLQSKIPIYIKMDVKIFKLLYIIPLIFSVFFEELIDIFIGFSNNQEFKALITLLLIFTSILLIGYCYGYCAYFAAKTFKTVEQRRKVIFGNFSIEFFLFLFYPIGIWIIQPKINKIFANENSEK